MWEAKVVAAVDAVETIWKHKVNPDRGHLMKRVSHFFPQDQWIQILSGLFTEKDLPACHSAQVCVLHQNFFCNRNSK